MATPARRRLLLYGLPLLAAAGVFVGVFFQPHKLFLDQRVNEAAVRRWFPDGDPIGEQVETGGSRFEVVGVVADVRQRHPGEVHLRWKPRNDNTGHLRSVAR